MQKKFNVLLKPDIGALYKKRGQTVPDQKTISVDIELTGLPKNRQELDAISEDIDSFKYGIPTYITVDDRLFLLASMPFTTNLNNQIVACDSLVYEELLDFKVIRLGQEEKKIVF